VVLAGRNDGISLARAFLGDAEATVRAQAAWTLGTLGDASDFARLEPLTKAPETDVAANAAAAIGRIAARAPQNARKPFTDRLCALETEQRPLVRPNALAGLAFSGARCQNGESERRAVSDDEVDVVRAAAARALSKNATADDRRVLDICAASDR